MCTREEVEQAIRILRAQGRDVEAVETSLEGGIAIPVDGIPRTPEEICAMAARIGGHS